jgi:phage tail-like protein
MRGPISEQEPAVLGVAAALRRAVPAVYQEDPLFALLCEAFDDLLAPLVTAVDCFDAYLDPYLAPSDFLPWLADLVGYQGTAREGTQAAREQIATAVRDHTRRGTAAGVRDAAARAAGVPVEQVELDDPGGTRWSTLPGGVTGGWPRYTAPRVRVPLAGAPPPAPDPEAVALAGLDETQVTPGRRRARNQDQDTQRTLAAVRAAIEAAAGVHSGIAVEAAAVETVAAQPRRSQPRGARTYGGGEP